MPLRSSIELNLCAYLIKGQFEKQGQGTLVECIQDGISLLLSQFTTCVKKGIDKTRPFEKAFNLNELHRSKIGNYCELLYPYLKWKSVKSIYFKYTRYCNPMGSNRNCVHINNFFYPNINRINWPSLTIPQLA